MSELSIDGSDLDTIETTQLLNQRHIHYTYSYFTYIVTWFGFDLFDKQIYEKPRKIAYILSKNF